MNQQKIPIANVYYLLCYAWDHIEESDVVRLDEVGELERVYDLLGKVLAEGTFRLIRRGIDRGYRDVREDIAGIRGKVDVGETVKRALRSQGRVACTFEEMSHDVLHNRILRSTLKTLMRLPELDRKVATSVRNAYTRLEGISTIPLSRRLFERVQLDRNRRYYRFLLSVCRLIHEQLLPDEVVGATRFADFSEEQMETLYEKFIIEFYRREQNTYRVNRSGRSIRWADDGTDEYQRRRIPRMEADVILESPNRRIIMDAKFDPEALSNRFGTSKLQSRHLYQLLAYLRNREATAEPGPQHEGMLLYPTVDEKVRVVVRLEGFPVTACSIDLGQPWQNIHTDMLALID